MIEYLIRSGLILVILLAVYRFWLEKEKMHWFNRFYLVASLIFSLTVPLVQLQFPEESFNAIDLPQLNSVVSQPIVDLITPVKVIPARQSFDYTILLIIYLVVTLALLIRFSINLSNILLTAARNPRKKTDMGTIVLLKEKVAPHSFLYFTFLSENDYVENKIEHEVLAHEFAHIRQKHSIDLLFIEIIRVVFWFNPIFTLYKKSIQLNHEFLADEAVISSEFDISAYQHLLLQKASLQTIKLASNLNYSITKLRFQMMKKQTSKTRKILKGFSLIPVATILLISFSGQTLAQGVSAKNELAANFATPGQLSKDEYYKGASMRFINKAGISIQKKYEELTAEEKSAYPSPIQPNEELMSLWKDTKKFAVLIGYEKPTQPLSNFKAKDFVSYYTTKSETGGLTYVFLIKSDWLENIKKLGGQFNMEGNQVFLAPPPPVAAPAKNK